MEWSIISTHAIRPYTANPRSLASPILASRSICATFLRALPVTRTDVRAMLAELKGTRLLHGARGFKSADMDVLVEVIYRTAELAQALGDRLESLEINPLRVDGSQIEALDAVITWESTGK